MTRRIKLTITDTLAFYDPSVKDYTFDPQTAQTTTYWFALPDGAIRGNEIRPEYRETLIRAIYGEHWRHGRRGASLRGRSRCLCRTRACSGWAIKVAQIVLARSYECLGLRPWCGRWLRSAIAVTGTQSGSHDFTQDGIFVPEPL